MKKSTAVSLLVTAGLLAVPAVSQAAETVGSDLEHAAGNQHTIYCGEDPQTTFPCTLVVDSIPWEVDAPDDHIITRWSAQLDQGTQARLRLLRRNEDGSFTGVDTSDAVTASKDGVQSFKTHIPVPAGNYTIGIDLLAGNVGAIHDPDGDYQLGFTAPPIPDGSTSTVEKTSYELLVGAQAETDYDSDGKGDETEDDCVWNDCGLDDGGGGGGGGGVPDPGSGGGGGGAGDTYVPTPRQADSPVVKGPPFVVDTRGLLRPGKEGRQGTFEVFAENEGSGEIDATFEVRAGRKSIGKRQITDLESGDEATVKFRLSRKHRRQLLRKGKLKLSLVANAKHDDGSTTPVRQDLTVLKGGATKYDGYYKGPGPIVFVVEGGAIRTVSSQVNGFCPSSNRHQPLDLFSIDGFPALVKPDGSFNHTGSGGGQQMTYKGKFSLKGKSKGYASVYRFELGLSPGGRYFTDGCTGATNWTATKTK